MICPECQQANPDTARFCLACGHSLVANCESCGAGLPTDARFCIQCGHLIAGTTTTDLDRVDRAAAATPRPLAEKLRAAPMTDERKLVTVLFVDVVGSTGMAESLDAEDWKTVINGAFQSLAAAVHRYEGTIAQFLGDGFLAFFGAPITHEDDPARAVRAALDLIDAAGEYGEQIRDRTGLEFAVRVGINSGQVVVGSVGTDLRYEYLAVGDTVNLAARLQSAAEPMTALISESTRRLISDRFEFHDLGLMEVRGRSAPTRVFTVERGRAVLEPEHRPVALTSPMVGREEELARLIAATDATRAGIGRLTVIVGEAGIGKSRLLREWRIAAQARNVRWVQANVPAHGAGLAYHLAAEATRSMLALAPDANTSQLVAVLRRLSAGEELMANRAYLAQLLSITDDGTATGSALTPQGRQARYVELVRGVARAATTDPLLLVLNDVHWSDPSSIDLLRWLLPLHAELPMLIALVTRPDRESVGWRLVEAAREAAGAGLEEIALQPLLADEGHRLLANLLEQHELPPTVAELVDDRAEGNPLFVEEMVHMLVDHGILTRGPDGWELQNDVGGADIPDTLQGLLAARIDRLEPEARTALRVASVIGRQFAVPVLERLLVRVQ